LAESEAAPPSDYVSAKRFDHPGARFVAQAIESALSQTFRNREIIVVENGSTDGTNSVLAGFTGRITLIHQQHPGISVARNAGIAASSGELIAFLDQDDLWDPGKLERQRVCVAVPTLGIPSETFIRNHIDRLSAHVIPLHGGPPPDRLSDGHRVDDLPGFFKQNRIDVVLAEYGQTGASLVTACRKAQVPLVVHFHGADAYDHEVLKIHRQRYAELFRSARRVVVVSKAMRNQLEALGCYPGKIRFVPCGVNLSQFRPVLPGVNPPVLTAVGRFVNKKAPYLAIVAFTIVVRTLPEARLVMVGGGPLFDACRMLSRALGIGDSVQFTGDALHSQVVEKLAQSRAFVQHSVVTDSGDSEGLPKAVLEACASGLPVVATAHAGIVDVITDGVNGFLVDEFDIANMANRMLQICTEPSLANRLG
jgi:glycosyltransferase involved in cell wall biosynthesis